MKTSVVMATYNGEAYLKEQLDSIREQTLPAGEVLIFDDGSKDRTVSIVENYIRNYQLQQTWKLCVNPKNLGYADNFHQAMMASSGEYIFFADQDDVWGKNKLETCAALLEQHQEIQLLCTDFDVLVSAENAPDIPPRSRKQMKKDGTLEKLELNQRNIYISSLGCVMCFRKSFRDQIEPYWKDGWPHDDYVWRMAQCMDGCYAYHVPMIQRRLHDHNVSMRKLHAYGQRMSYFSDVEMGTKQCLQFGKNIGMEPKKLYLLERHIKAIQMRAALVGQKKWLTSISLLGYLDCYYSKKSYLMELYLALKNKKKQTK